MRIIIGVGRIKPALISILVAERVAAAPVPLSCWRAMSAYPEDLQVDCEPGQCLTCVARPVGID